MLLECFFWHAPWIWRGRIARNIRHLSDSWSMLEPHFRRSPPIYHWIGLREILQESPEIFAWVKTVKTMVFGDFPTNPWNFGWWTPYMVFGEDFPTNPWNFGWWTPYMVFGEDFPTNPWNFGWWTPYIVFGEDFPTNPWNFGWWTPYLLNCSGWAQYVRLQRQRASSGWRTAGEKVRSGGAQWWSHWKMMESWGNFIIFPVLDPGPIEWK